MSGVDLASVGRSVEFAVSYSEQDVLLYALGVGAGQADPLRELEFTTENSTGMPLQVLPTFAIVLAQTGLGRRLEFGGAGTALVHAEQELEMFGMLPPDGTVSVSASVKGIYDKGSSALVQVETFGCDPSGRKAFRTLLGYFVRGAGGFGVRQPEKEKWVEPTGQPDEQLTAETRTDQALLYRLCGDRNPLHSDPAYARRAGFDRPILHGLCTLGIVARLLMHARADGEPSGFGRISARFSRPVYPGDVLTTSLWDSGDNTVFQTCNTNGMPVLTQGIFVARQKGRGENGES